MEELLPLRAVVMKLYEIEPTLITVALPGHIQRVDEQTRLADDPWMIHDHLMASGAVHYYAKEDCWAACVHGGDGDDERDKFWWVMIDRAQPPEWLYPFDWGHGRISTGSITCAMAVHPVMLEALCNLPKRKQIWLFDRASPKGWLKTLTDTLQTLPHAAFVDTIEPESLPDDGPLDNFHILGSLRESEPVRRVTFYDQSQLLLVPGGIRPVVEQVRRQWSMQIENGRIHMRTHLMLAPDGWYGTA